MRREGRAALLVVVDSDGSSPGRTGFKMLVSPAAPSLGSVGGGILEYRLEKQARRLLREGGSVQLLQRLLHDGGATPDSSGLVCAGEQTVLTRILTESDLTVVEQIGEHLVTGKAAILEISSRGMALRAPDPEITKPIFVIDRQVDDGGIYKEPLAQPYTCYIIGGGHVGRALCRQLDLLDFRTVVLDDRPEIVHREYNPWAHNLQLCPFDAVGEQVPEGSRNYAVIMTPSHRADEKVLRQLVAKNLAYLGMMGSRSKVAGIFSRLREDGVSEAVLGKVHSPIGLPIGSHTPAEIAVSIAAELIKERRRQQMPD